VPVIATPVGHIKQYINGFNGLTFPPQNDFVLKKKLELLINSSKRMKSMGHTARATIVKRYNWSRTIKDIKRILGKF